MATDSHRKTCPCGSKQASIILTDQISSGYKGRFFIVGQANQCSPPRNGKPPLALKPQNINVVTANRVRESPAQPQLAIVHPIIATEQKLKSMASGNEAPKPYVKSGFSFTITIADAIKEYYESGKTLKPVKEGKPRIGQPCHNANSESRSSYKSSRSENVSGKHVYQENVNGFCRDDLRTSLIAAMNKILSAVNGDENSSDEDENIYDWDGED